MKPIKAWGFFDWIWVIFGAAIIALHLSNIYEVFTETGEHETSIFILSLLVVIVWTGLIYHQLVIAYKRDLFWEKRRKELDAEWEARIKRITDIDKKGKK